MPRRNAPRRRSASATSGSSSAASSSPRPSVSGSTLGQRTELWRGAQFSVRPVAGTGSGALYRCPGCDQQVAASRPHVVAWPAEDPDAEDRRHWHSACWAARDRRQPGVLRSRNAPKYG